MSVLRLLSVCLLSMLALSAFADAASDEAAQQLAKQFAAMNSIRAGFQQTILDERGEVLQQASGRLMVKRPRQFFWRTTDPYEHLIVASDDVLWIYDIDLEQVSRQPFTDDLDKAPALILSGESQKLAQQYQIALQRSAADQLTFTLTPNSSGGVFSQLQLVFKAGKLASMTLVDSFQQQTAIVFSDVEYNVDIDPATFEFVPPPDIDVIVNES